MIATRKRFVRQLAREARRSGLPAQAAEVRTSLKTLYTMIPTEASCRFNAIIERALLEPKILLRSFAI